MTSRTLTRFGIISLIPHALLLFCCFLFLMLSPNGVPLLLTLFFGVPFLLASAAGVFMIGKIKWLPFAYLLVSAVALCLVYWCAIPADLGDFVLWLQVLGTVFCGVSALIALLSLKPAMVVKPLNKPLLGGGLVALGLLCLAALAFLFLLTLLVPGGEGVSALPI